MALESPGDWYPTRNGHRNGRRLGVVLQASSPRIVALEGQVADLRRELPSTTMDNHKSGWDYPIYEMENKIHLKPPARSQMVIDQQWLLSSIW